MSILAQLDVIRRCIPVLTDGAAEEEFLKALRLQEQFRQKYMDVDKEAQRLRKELDTSLQSLAHLEAKLHHARRLITTESKLRRKAEQERDLMERKMIVVAELLQQRANVRDDLDDKLAFFKSIPRKRLSVNSHVEEKYGHVDTSSFLSDLCTTQSDDDSLEIRPSITWRKHQPSKNHVPCIGSKLSRSSGGALRSIPAASSPRSIQLGDDKIQHQFMHLELGSDGIRAVTKVTVPQDGSAAIGAESRIGNAFPVAQSREYHEEINLRFPQRSTCKHDNALPMINKLDTSPVAMNSPSRQVLRKHSLATHSFLRTHTCIQCHNQIPSGTVGLRCRECRVRCHTDCGYLLSINCVPQAGMLTNKAMVGYICDYAPNVAPMIPALIVHCVYEIEARGLSEPGIYRFFGSEGQVKSLKERFLRGKATPQLGNIDTNVLCGCIKDFLCSLRESLVPTSLREDFSTAVLNPTEAGIQEDLLDAIDGLPQANRDTLAFMVLHFQRISECREARLPIEKIARIFGPAIVRYPRPDVDRHDISRELYLQVTIMQNLLQIASEYWAQFVVSDSETENIRRWKHKRSAMHA